MRLLRVLRAKRKTLSLVGVCLLWYSGVWALSLLHWGMVGSTMILCASLFFLSLGIFFYRRRATITGAVWYLLNEEHIDRTIAFCLKNDIPFDLKREDTDYRIGFIDENDLVCVKMGA